jgi:hypothetical protein
MSDRYRWQAANALAVAFAALGERRKSQQYVIAAHANPYSRQFPREQLLADAEVSIHNGMFEHALQVLTEAEEEDSSVFELRDRIVLFERVGKFSQAAELRQRLEAQRNKAFGDDQRAVEADDRATRSFSRAPSPAPSMDAPNISSTAPARQAGPNESELKTERDSGPADGDRTRNT